MQLNNIQKHSNHCVMNTWLEFPNDRLLAELALWSADVAGFAKEIERTDPYADPYHMMYRASIFRKAAFLYQSNTFIRKQFYKNALS